VLNDTVMPMRVSSFRNLLYCLGLVSLLLLAPISASASIVFNWPDNGWTAGTPGPGQTVTQSFTSVNPNDITVSINNNGVSGSGGNWQAGYPQIDATTSTGGFTGVDGLQLYMASQSSTSSYVRVTVSFASAVTNLSFQLWDVDALDKQFADTISNIRGLALGGGTVGPDSVTSAVAGYNTITGTGLSTVVTGIASANNSTNQGTIDITFLGPITQFSFDWSNSDGKLGAQAIALGPITYAPEPLPSWTSAVICGLAVVGWEAKRRRRRSIR
jgi:hypothetical protein